MSKIYLSVTANPILAVYLEKQGHTISWIKRSRYTYDPVCSHPDIYLCSLGPGRPIFFGDPVKLGPAYPQNIIYNAACTGNFFIHNLKFTAPELLRRADFMEHIHVSQGYAKCNIVVVDETSIITSDHGIFNACHEKLDVLLIESGHVKLPGFPYGFLGGASGRIGKTILFHGNLEEHPDCKKIAAFIKDRDLKLKYFTEYELTDIGSVIEHV